MSFSGQQRYYRSTLGGLQRCCLPACRPRAAARTQPAGGLAQGGGALAEGGRRTGSPPGVRRGLALAPCSTRAPSPEPARRDILDGFHPKAESLAALCMLRSELDALGRSHHHTVGNHCFYNLPRHVRAGPTPAAPRAAPGRSARAALQVLNEELRMGTATSASYYAWCASWLRAGGPCTSRLLDLGWPPAGLPTSAGALWCWTATT